jgi:hypothetical protein
MPVLGEVKTKEIKTEDGKLRFGSETYSVVEIIKHPNGRLTYVTNQTIEDKCTPLYITDLLVEQFQKREGIMIKYSKGI